MCARVHAECVSIQRKREVTLAVALVERLAKMRTDGRAQFIEWATAEAAKLVAVQPPSSWRARAHRRTARAVALECAASERASSTGPSQNEYCDRSSVTSHHPPPPEWDQL